MAGFSNQEKNDLPVTGVPSFPSANNLLAWTFDPFFASANNTLPTGTGVFMAFTPSNTLVLTTANKLWVYLGTAPTTTTYGAIGIYNAAGQLLAISSNTNAFGTAGAVSSTLAAGVTLYSGVTYYLGVVCLYTVGTLALWGFSASDPAALDNINISTPAAGALGFRSQSMAGLSSLPATLPATVPTSNSAYTWVGIS